MTTPARNRAPRSAGGPALTRGSSKEARLLAAAILALRGLLAACEAKPRGAPRQEGARELTALRQQVARLERDLARQQTLVRLTQRSVGLPATPAPPATPTKKGGKRTRRSRARAVPVVARLRHEATPESAPPVTDSTPTDGTAP